MLDLKHAINQELVQNKSFVFNYFQKHTEDVGLVLNTGPTGIGKSYNSALYILLDFINKKYINIDIKYKTKKMFFITDRIANVISPYIETQNIIKDFINKYNLSQFTEDFLLSKIALVQSNPDTLLALFAKNTSKSVTKYKYQDLYDLIDDSDKTGYLRRSIESLIVELNHNKKDGENLALREEISQAIGELKKIYEKRDLVNTSYQKEDLLSPLFIGDEMEDDDKISCFFMTTAKAFHGSKKTKGRAMPFEYSNNIYIMDEFDKQADEILNRVLEEKGDYDLHLLTQELKKIYHTSFKINLDHSGDKIEKLRLNFIDQKLEPFGQKYSFSNSLALDENSKDKKVSMFQDNDYGVLFTKGTYVDFNINENENTNLVKIANKNEVVTYKKLNFVSFVEDNFQLLKDFSNMLRSASKYYKKDSLLLSTSQKISILAKELHLDKNMISFILEQTLEKKENFSDFQLENIFEAEKSIHTIELKGEDEIVKLKAKSLNYTANKLIKDLALNNLVFGISATANNESVIKNFNLKYLRKELGNKYYEFDNTDKDELEKERHSYNIDYEQKVNLVVKEPDNKINKVDLEDVLFKNDIYIENYQQEKLITLANAVLEFVNNPSSKYMFAVNSRLLTSEDSFVISELVNKNATKKSDKYTLFPTPSKKDKEKINSKFFNKNGMEKILNELKTKKVIVLTHFSTIGAGMNLQAKGIIPDSKNYVKINDNNRLAKADEFDIDTLYMEKPTCILLPPEQENKYLKIDEKLRLIYNMQGLLHNNQISYTNYNEVYKNISKIDERKDAEITFEHSLYKNTSDYFNVLLALVKQFIGRGSRTLIKNKNETIFVTNDLINVLNQQKIVVEKYDLRGFKELVKFIESRVLVIPKNSDNKTNYQNMNNDHKFNKAKNLILANLNNHEITNYSKYVNAWEQLREFTLKNGVFIDETQKSELSALLHDDVAIHLDKPSTKITFSVARKNGEIDIVDYSKGCEEFNEDNLNLSVINNNEELKKYFDEHSYLTKFIPNSYALPVSCINDIYKGAIGEVIVKYFIEKILSFEIDEKYTLNNGIYEIVDFFIANSKIGVDAKNYQMNFFKEEYSTELVKKLNFKLDINSNLMRKALVLNAFSKKAVIQYGVVDENGFMEVSVENKNKANVLAINGIFSSKDGSLLISVKELRIIKEWIENA